MQGVTSLLLVRYFYGYLPYMIVLIFYDLREREGVCVCVLY